MEGREGRKEERNERRTEKGGKTGRVTEEGWGWGPGEARGLVRWEFRGEGGETGDEIFGQERRENSQGKGEARQRCGEVNINFHLASSCHGAAIC